MALSNDIVSQFVKITNDKTYGEVLIECRNYDEEKEILVNLVERLLQNNDGGF